MRITAVNDRPEAGGDYVLYWMIAARRTTYSYALDHAIDRAKALGVPLVVLEPLRAGYAWASDRMHAFVMQGMADNAQAFAKAGITYLSYVEPAPGQGKGLLEALAKHAALVITDEQMGFFQPHMVSAAGKKLGVRLEQVDGNGVLPLRAAPKAFSTAASFRRHLQKTLLPFLMEPPRAHPLQRLPASVKGGEIPGPILRKWPSATSWKDLPIDHSVAPVTYQGGSRAGDELLEVFIDRKLARYAERSHPDAGVASGLSPWLHFGHVGVHAVLAAIAQKTGWDPMRLAGAKVTGSREGWWGMPASEEAFLDEVVTWRELGHVYCFHEPNYADYATLPDWARKTLADHTKDKRPTLYTRAELEGAKTHDVIWNAAQRQLVADGRIDNYLRMLWGKKVLEWSTTPQVAFETLLDLNNKYSVDGRDPNSYSGVAWTFGRFDRAWGPVRPIFGTIRYMSSDSTKKKLDMKQWLARWS